MYGHINLIFRSYFIERHGQDAWDNIVKQCKCSSTFDDTAVYDDSVSQRILDISTRILGLKREVILELIGEFYFEYLRRSRFDEFTRNLGENILDFLQNLDSLHCAMTSQYPECNAPSFSCECESSKDRIILHYYSFRRGYAHLVIGILRAVAKTYFSMDLNISITSVGNEKVSSKHAVREHVVYAILATRIEGDDFSEGPPTLVAQTKKHGERQIQKQDVESVRRRLSEIRREYGEEALPIQLHRARIARAKWMAVAKMSIIRKGFVINYPQNLAINPRRFCEIFPYHIIFTQLMKVHQSGEQLQKMMPTIRTSGADMLLFFSLINPHSMDFTYENVKRFINTPFVLSMKPEKLSKEWKKAEELVLLKGQMIELRAESMFLYLGSPFVRSFSDLEERKIFYADIAGHDVTRDLLFMDMIFRQQYYPESNEKLAGHHRKSGRVRGAILNTNGGSDDINDLRAELEQTQRELDEERERNALLMNHYLPRAVVDRSRNGEKFNAGEYSPVSVLFCDIVNFLQYPTECKVSNVVSLLNQLYEKFETVTRVHDTFRIESIGDAYLVVSGIPDKVPTHVERVANTALGLLIICEEVKSPISWSQNIEIRIGMHSGSLKCGVVGHRIPKMVVMGETVTVASRMESHGEPGRIHITPSVYNVLRNKGYTVKERGEVTLRGLGELSTYFLLSNNNATYGELIGQPLHDKPMVFINDGNQENPDLNKQMRGSLKSNKVKPQQGTPSSGVGSSNSRRLSCNDDLIPFVYSDSKQHKNTKIKK